MFWTLSGSIVAQFITLFVIALFAHRHPYANAKNGAVNSKGVPFMGNYTLPGTRTEINRAFHFAATVASGFPLRNKKTTGEIQRAAGSEIILEFREAEL